MANQTSAGTRKKTSATKKSSAKKRSETLRAKSQAARLWSVFVFALALLLIALTYIPGQAGWTAVQNVCFGLFGWVLYLVAPVVLYIAVLVAAGHPYKAKLLESTLVLILLCGIALVFSKFTPAESSKFSEIIAQLYTLGSQHKGGGVLAAPLGLLLLNWAGRPAANILLIILLIIFVMVLADVTPADIFDYLHRKASVARDNAGEALSLRDERREERLQQVQERRSARQAAAAEKRNRPKVDPNLPPETADKPRDRWNIDVNLTEEVNPNPPQDTEPVAAAPLATAKGEAFDPSDYTELADVLQHDVLAAAGRDALQPKKEPVAVPAAAGGASRLFDAEAEGVMEVTVPAFAPAENAQRRPLFDQDAQSASQPAGSVFLRPEEPREENQPAASVFLAESEETTGAPGEIDDLIRRALDGRPAAPSAEPAAPVCAPAAVPTPQAAAAKEPEPPAPVCAVAAPPYHLPSVDLLDRQPNVDQGNVNAEMRHNAQVLVSTLESFGVKTKILDICRGPSVTRYELQPLAGVKISRITSLADDIALNLASAGVRIEAPIPGKPAVGIEVPNKVKATVSLRSLIQAEEFEQTSSTLAMCLGRDIAGSVKVADLSKMPHLLIAGTTGSGKSVCINSIIMSFLYKSTPEELRLMMIDPKVVELAEYNGIPHLLMPVVTEPRKAAGALGSAVAEMERRYQLFASNNVRDIKSFNRLAEGREDLEKIPYIAIIIDELADLMMVAGKQVEDYICRIAQKARAAGMHLIVATQRPSVDVITGLIKANIPSRIAFAVSNQVDSRTILDSAGAEKLLGMGDMLFMPVGASKPVRIQGTFVKDSEIERVIGEIKTYADSRYDEQMIADSERRAAAPDGGAKDSGSDDEENTQDPMLRPAIETVVDAGMASTSLLQRKLKLGYARAARIMDEMEALHVIGPYEGSKPRQVLITRDQYLEMTMNGTPES